MGRHKIKTAAELVAPYVPMLREFLTGRVAVRDFEQQFNVVYLSDNRRRTHEMFQLLDGFFVDVDQTVEEPDVPDRDFLEITVPELKERAAELLAAGGYALAADDDQ